MTLTICNKVSQWTNRHGISGSVLKVVAVLSMLIDHIGMIFLEELASTSVGYYRTYYIFRIIGRLSFPIFAFLVSEGICHTKNIYKYALRMLIFACLCEVPFDIVINGTVFDFSSSNVFFTFLLSIIPIAVVKNIKNIYAFFAVFLLTFAACAVGAHFIGTVYSYYGIALVLTFYIFKKYKPFDMALAAVLLFAAWPSGIQAYALLAIPIIFFYNGERGFINTKIKQLVFYGIYPIHLLIFYGIYMLIN